MFLKSFCHLYKCVFMVLLHIGNIQITQSQGCSSPPVERTTFDPAVQNYSAGETVTVTCDPGYYIDDSMATSFSLECGEGVNWIGDIKECLPVCSDIQTSFCDNVSPQGYARRSDGSTCLVYANIRTLWAPAFGLCENMGMKLSFFERRAENILMAGLLKVFGIPFASTNAWWIAYRKDTTKQNWNNEFKAYSTPTNLSVNRLDLSKSSLSNTEPTLIQPVYPKSPNGDCIVLSPTANETFVGKTLPCGDGVDVVCSKDLRCITPSSTTESPASTLLPSSSSTLQNFVSSRSSMIHSTITSESKDQTANDQCESCAEWCKVRSSDDENGTTGITENFHSLMETGFCEPCANWCSRMDDDHEDVMKLILESFDLDFNISHISQRQSRALNKEVSLMGIDETDGELSVLSQVEGYNVISMRKLDNDINNIKNKLERLMNPRNQFFIQCLFNDERCQIETDFVTTFQPKFGICYSFNYKKNTTQAVNHRAIQKGLDMLINTNKEEYMLTSDTGGIKVLVHENDGYPFVDTFGNNFPIQTDALLMTSLTSISRALFGVHECAESPHEMWNYYGEVKYSYEGCMRSYLQSKTVEACKCFNPDFAKGPSHTNLDDCVVGDRCLSKIEKHFGNKSLESTCKIECRKTYFKVESSFSTMRDSVMHEVHGFKSSEAIRLVVKLKTQIVVAIEEYPAMRREDIFWSFCAIVGLFLGISGIEIFALATSAVQLVILKCFSVFKKFYKK